MDADIRTDGDDTKDVYPVDGVEGGDASEKAGAPPPQPRHFEALVDMYREGFRFFTPALITTHGLLDRDPVVEFDKTHQTTDPDERVMCLDCEYPLFEGIGVGLLGGKAVNWDHRLYAAIEETAAQCISFLSAVSAYSAAQYHYFRVGTYTMPILDPIAFNGHRGLTHIPMVEITVCCVATNRSFAWLEPAKDPPRTKAYLQVGPPRPEVQAEAAAVLGPPPQPHNLVKFREGLDAYDRDRIAEVNRSQRFED